MTTYFLTVAAQVMTLFLLMGVGYVVYKLGHITQTGLNEMSYLLMYLVIPCLIIHSLQTSWDPNLLCNLVTATVVALGLYLLNALLAIPLFRKRGEAQRLPLQFGAIYCNCGFMGLPLVHAVLGDQALLYTTVAVVCFNVVAWTHGIALMGGRKAISLKKVFFNPGVIALIIGLPLFLLRIQLPSVAGSAISFFTNLNTPLAMVVIGGQMAQTNLSTLFRTSYLYSAAAVKLMFIPILTAALLYPLGLDPLLYITFVLLAATPAANMTSIFAQRFGRDVGTAAQLVSLSTLLSVVTLPLFAVLAAALAGYS